MEQLLFVPDGSSGLGTSAASCLGYMEGNKKTQRTRLCCSSSPGVLRLPAFFPPFSLPMFVYCSMPRVF